MKKSLSLLAALLLSALLQEAIRRRPNKADAYWNLSVAYQLLGKKEEARQAVEKTLELDPRNPHALAALEEIDAVTSGQE